jgi:hypothetical protein
MQKSFISASIAAALLTAASGIATATTFTTTSPTGGALPAGVTQVGGIVLDLTGLNGARVVSQLPASALFSGFADTGTPAAFQGNPLTIGIQTGFGPAVTNSLGGGLLGASVRITLFDGDTAPGNFDANANFLRLNGVNFGAGNGNFTAVVTEQTTGAGGAIGGGTFGTGFGDNVLNTGFFSSTDPTVLGNLFTSIDAADQVTFQLFDAASPFDNNFDFTQGVDGGLINVGSPPVVTPPSGSVPEPTGLALIGLGIAALGAIRRRRKD